MTNQEFKDCRVALGVSQELFAKLLGCSQSRISEIETGHTGSKPTKQHEMACRAIECLHDNGILQDFLDHLQDN